MTNHPQAGKITPGQEAVSQSVQDVRNMAGLLFIWSRGRRQMAVLRAYIDESGVGDDSTAAGYVFASAGFLGATDDWERFTKRWVEALLAEGLPNPPELHMKLLLHGQGAFKGWDEPRRSRLLGTLITIINETPLLGHGCVIARGSGPKDWEKTYSGHVLSSARHYYAAGVIRCIWELASRASGFLGADEKVGFVCGSNENWEGGVANLYEIMKKESRERLVSKETTKEMLAIFGRLGPIAFESPKEFPPLQAADLLAYESRRRYIDQHNPDRDRPRASLVRLESGQRISYCLHKKDDMEPIFEKVLADPEYENKKAAWRKKNKLARLD